MKVAVILTTYNRPDALEAAVLGYFAQQGTPFELLIADDGSKEDTAACVRALVAKAPFPMRHVWQEDLGFRPGAARNRAAAATDADYLVFSDGDCVPPPDFVARHAGLAEPGYFVAGNRILLSEKYTRSVLDRHDPIHAWGAGKWLAAWMRRDVNRALPLLRLPDGDFRRRSPDRWEGVKTCNLAVWRSDFVRVNGFDEHYAGWGLEDSDLVIRLIHAGVHHKTARLAAPVFHLWHRENDRSRLAENQRLLDEILASTRIEARLGLDQYRR